MAIKQVVRYRLDATVSGEIPYDPAIPTSYGDALGKVDEMRQAFIKAGGKITHDRVAPAQSKE